jgi:hypothetical protein
MKTARILALALAAVTTAASAAAQDGPVSPLARLFLTDCKEFVGITPAPLANVDPRVPPAFTVVQPEPGRASLVVRVARCASLRVDGGAPRPYTLSQIGAVIEPPATPGDIDVFALFQTTDDLEVATLLSRLGFYTTWQPGLSFTFSPSLPGRVVVTASVPGPFRHEVAGTGTFPSSAPAPFVANWWGIRGTSTPLAQARVGGVRFGDGSAIRAIAPVGSGLAVVAGRNLIDFPSFAVTGAFPYATVSLIP